jgi:hypothetical protein
MDTTDKKDKKRTGSDKNGQVISADQFQGNGSEQIGHDSGGIFTREERTQEELDRLMREAADLWN